MAGGVDVPGGGPIGSGPIGGTPDTTGANDLAATLTGTGELVAELTTSSPALAATLTGTGTLVAELTTAASHTVGFDTFTEASLNTALNAHTPEIGAMWSLEVAQFTVFAATDKLQHNRAALDRARKGDNIGDDDHDVTVVCSVGATSRIAGACGRMSTDGFTNQYEALLLFNSATQQDVKLFKNISGTRTQVGTTATITLGSGVDCTLKLEIRAGSQKISIDGVVVVTGTEPDTTLAGRNFAGVIMNANATGAFITSFQSENVIVPDLSAFLIGTGELVAALTTDILLAASLLGTGDLVAELTTSGGGASGDLGSATLSGTGNLAAELATDLLLAAALAGTGELIAALTTDLTMAATLPGTGQLVAALTTDLSLAATLPGSGALVAELSAPNAITLSAELRGTGTLQVALSGGHVTLRFATYDIYIGGQLVELGVLDDTAVTVSLTDTYTGAKQYGGVTVRIGLGRGPEVAALFDNATKGAGLRIYRYDATTTVQTLIFDGIVNTLGLDTTALVLEGVQASLKILEMKIPVALVDTSWPQAFGSGLGVAVDIDQPIPDLVGSVPRSKCLYINKDLMHNIYDYAIGKVRGARSVPAMYRSVSSSSGKDQVSLINPVEYTLSVGDQYPGYLTARFTVEQISTSGGPHTIYADVVTNPDMAITRNPARVVRTYLQEAGQAIVAASFDAAEAEFARLGYVLDFALTEQVQLQELTKDISLMLDSVFNRTSLGWTLDVDTRPTTVKYQFTEGPDVTPTIIEISPVSLTPLENETSAVIVKYLPDSLDKGTFLGTVQRALSASTHASPLELTFPWIRSWDMADRIADYKAKQIRTRDRTLTITGPRLSALPIRELVLVTSPRRRLTNAIYLIKSIAQSALGQPELQCVSWGPDPYVYTPGAVPVDPILGTFSDFSRVPPPVITDVTFPAGAPFEGVEIGPAGAMKAFITMRFVTPTGGNYAYAVVRYRITSTVLWVPVGGPITQLGTVDIKIRNLEPQVSYDFSVQAFNQWGLTAGGE